MPAHVQDTITEDVAKTVPEQVLWECRGCTDMYSIADGGQRVAIQEDFGRDGQPGGEWHGTCKRCCQAATKFSSHA